MFDKQLLFASFLLLVAGLLLFPCHRAFAADGDLCRESSRPEVYLIEGGRKIWVPTPATLFALGKTWADVKVVPDGSLGAFQRFDIPSSSATPGSLVYPPPEPKLFALTGVAGAVTVHSKGKRVELIELYGWLRWVQDPAAPMCGDGWDFHYALELDTDWALAHGIDLNRLLRVGNIAPPGPFQIPGSTPRKAVSLPLIGIELDSWDRDDPHPTEIGKPPDWQFKACGGHIFPFDPLNPVPGSTLQPLAEDWNTRGPYVRISGSLVTDSPHDVQWRPNTFFSRNFAWSVGDAAEWEGSVPDWSPKTPADSPEHYARWTEIHPVDRVQVVTQQTPRVTVRGVALAARTGALPWNSNSCEQTDFDLAPEAARPTNPQIGFEEIRGSETYFPWGENKDNGSWITNYWDHIHVKARVCGGTVFGSPGRFKAIYRVWWSNLPPPPPLTPCQQNRKSAACKAFCTKNPNDADCSSPDKDVNLCKNKPNLPQCRPR